MPYAADFRTLFFGSVSVLHSFSSPHFGQQTGAISFFGHNEKPPCLQVYFGAPQLWQVPLAVGLSHPQTEHFQDPVEEATEFSPL